MKLGSTGAKDMHMATLGITTSRNSSTKRTSLQEAPGVMRLRGTVVMGAKSWE